MAIALLVAGALIVLGYLAQRRRGRDPLGPSPAGALPDTAFAALAGTFAWLFLRTMLMPVAMRTGFVRDGGYVSAVFVSEVMSFALALALLPSATRGERRPHLSWPAITFAGIASGVAVFAMQMPLGHAIQALYRHAGRDVPQQEIVQKALGAQGPEVLVFGISALVLAPFAEEVYFRGTLLPAMGRAMSPQWANLLQAVIFGAIHVLDAPAQWPLAIPLALVGWCAGWIYLRTALLAAPILLHATFNAINFAAMRSG